jgi:hypothetical protein
VVSLTKRDPTDTPLHRLIAELPKPPGECWPWNGSVREDGYGWVAHQGAHRAVYKVLVGLIPEGMTVDHECHNRSTDCQGGRRCRHRRCVNPDHLVLRSHATNSGTTVESRKTHCLRGHPRTAENTYVSPRTGWKKCRVCHRATQARRDAQQRSSPAA